MRDVDVGPLASKLVALVPLMFDCDIPYTTVRQLTRLTALSMAEPFVTLEQLAVHPLAGAASLRHLQLDTSAGGWMLPGLSTLCSLRNLDLSTFSIVQTRPEAMAMVGRATQLTSLALPSYDETPVWHNQWRQLLQQLTGLRRLRIDQATLQACSGVMCSLEQLTQLVVCQYGKDWSQVLPLRMVVGPLRNGPTSLQHVVYVCERPGKNGLSDTEQPPQEVVPSPLPGVRVTVTSTTPSFCQTVLPRRPMRPCPHLPGVKELLRD
jgi:hypothetical protein